MSIFANRLVSLKMRDYLAAISPAAFGSTVMALALLAFRYAVTNMLTLPDIALLISSVLLGAFVYYISSKMSRTEAMGEMIGLVLEMIRPYAKLVMAKMPLVRR